MKYKRLHGFTLIELLVVVAIIAVLVTILLPGLSAAREMSRALVSQSNMKQWGTGAVMFAQEENDRFPWEGEKTDMLTNFASNEWWANAVPPMISQPAYANISDEATSKGKKVPIPPSHSIFVDPSALVPSDAPYIRNGKQFFFCYIWNSELDNELNGNKQRMGTGRIEYPSVTILMLEARTIQDELPSNDFYYDKSLDRHRGDWKRFANRHSNGGHIVYADGHVNHVSNKEATTNSSGSRDPDTPNGDWNTSRLIWDPLGPATD